MASDMAAEELAATRLPLKLLIDSRAQRVLYAEAGKDVVDFLFSLLALPLAAVTRLLTAGAMVGSVGALYGSVEKLDADYACRRGATDALLLSPALLHLAAPEEGSGEEEPGALYRCSGCGCSKRCYDYATKVRGTPCPVCKRGMTAAVALVEPGGAKAAAPAPDEASNRKGYVRGMVIYTVMDDLSVAAMSTITAIAALVKLGVKDISELQEKTVEVGYKEGLAILQASLQSKTVLTDVFLGTKKDKA